MARPRASIPVPHVSIGDASIALDLRHWVNDGALALFFLAVGLEISRELTVGELHHPRDRLSALRNRTFRKGR